MDAPTIMGANSSDVTNAHLSHVPRTYAERMTGMFHELPLSNRQRQDESAVTGDWRLAEADVVRAAHTLLAGRSQRDRQILSRAFLTTAHLARTDDTDLEGVAEGLARGERRRVRDLSRTVTALLTLARDTGASVSLAPRTSGAVALYLATSGAFDVRAVVRGHTIRSSDDGWEFGRGPVMEDTSVRVLSFLCGISPEAPRHVAPRG